MVLGGWGAVASHPQSRSVAGQTVSVQFDHDGDNEWWVEVLTKASGGSIVAMEVRAESSSTSHGLQNKAIIDGWTKWGPETSFRIPPGDRVMFRAHVVADPDGSPGTIDSCFFTHPEGVEQCDTSGPIEAWHVRILGQAGIASHAGDMAIGDADNNGRRDVTIGTRNGVYTFERNEGEWSGQRVGTLASTSSLAVGDGDGDGRHEIYAMANNALVEYVFADGAWQETVLLSFPERFAGDMTLGDIDGQVGPELYVGLYDTSCDPDTHLCSSSAQIYQVRSASGAWTSTPVASLSGHVDSMWVGDGDRDGDVELYVGHGTRHADHVTQVQREGGSWQSNSLPGTGSGGGFSLVVAGDGDRSGMGEVYTLNYEGHLRQLTHGSSGWTATDVFPELRTPEGTHLAPQTLFLGDGDADGSQELYIGTDHGQVYQVRFTDGVWKSTRIASVFDGNRDVPGGSGLVAVGNGDGDGTNEVYAGISFQSHGSGDDGVTRVFKLEDPLTGFDTRFTDVRGNEWWVQTDVQVGAGDLSKVEVRLDGGDWKPLAKKSWGGWAASYHIVEGTVVQFRATGPAGAEDISACYRWIPSSGAVASKASCPSTPPDSFDARFSGVRGNEWWVQANVAATGGALAKVDVRLNGGEWKPLSKQSWGGWAASYRIVDGTTVQFRTTSTTGARDLSDCYAWIPPSDQNAAKFSCGSPPGMDATFTGVKGNDWWVQVDVKANQPIAGVDARVDCGAWVALEKKSWGSWAESFHVPAGSKVDFRAISSTGEVDRSGAYLWPEASPTTAC